MTTLHADNIKAAFLGAAVGDALGVPVEFQSRETLKRNPVTDMRAFGTHHQPAGAWSDDSSLLFCTAESLCGGYNLPDMATRFTDWLYRKYWTSHNEVFDVGNATRAALERLNTGAPHTASGLTGEHDNGNGSLMRILPMVFFLHRETDIEKRMCTTGDVSSITHAHAVSCIACELYVETGLDLTQGTPLGKAWEKAFAGVEAYYREKPEGEFLSVFARLADPAFRELPEQEIRSGGYVAHTLEAAIWCLMNSADYAGAVLKAVNLGGDTDTTACVAGGLAGLCYGIDSIPAAWLNALARKADIEGLADRFYQSLKSA